jgi:BclB C-terminal domain-containing protein
MTTVLGGIENTSSVLPLDGNAVATGVTVSGGVIDATPTSGADTLGGIPQSVPQAETITSVAGYFSTNAALTLIGSTVTVTAQLYSSTTPNNTFTAVPGAIVTLAPALTGILALGTDESGITTGLSIPVTAQTRLMVVYSATVTAGLDVATTISGAGSAGIGYTASAAIPLG